MCEKSPYLKYLEKHYYSRIKLEKMKDRNLMKSIEDGLINGFKAENQICQNTCKEDIQIIEMIKKEHLIFKKKVKNLLLSEPHVTTLFEQAGKEKL